MEPKQYTKQIFDEELQAYLSLDEEGDYVLEEYMHLNNPDEEFKNDLEKNQQLDILENSLLVWLGFVEPSYRQYVEKESIEIGLTETISVNIKDGVYFFELFKPSKSEYETDKLIPFSLIYPGHPKYMQFTSELKSMVTVAFDTPEKQKTFKRKNQFDKIE